MGIWYLTSVKYGMYVQYILENVSMYYKEVNQTLSEYFLFSPSSPQGTQEDRNYPLQVSVMASAKVQEVVGFTCWKYTAEGRQPPLQPDVDRYSLYIADADGSIETEFPALDRLEPISKFGFPVLGLVEAAAAPAAGATEDSGEPGDPSLPSELRVTVYLPDGTFTLLEVETRNVALRTLMERAFEK